MNACQRADACRLSADCESFDFCIDAVIEALPVPDGLAQDLGCQVCDD